MNVKSKIGAAALAVVISAGACMLPASAGSYLPMDESVSQDYVADGLSTSWRGYLNLKGVYDKSVWSYSAKSVNVAGKVLSVRGLNINGKDYIPSRAASNAIGLSYSYNSKTGMSTVKGKNLEMTFTSGCYVSYANGRVLFSESPVVIMSDGRMYVPADVFAKAVGLKLSSDSSSVSLSGSLNPILSGDKFYKSDEVLWLGRIIHAESSGEPLLGQIAVGNVVLNRVKSAYYPNTIYGVIFDRKYGVQFSPVLNGTIYNTPCYNSTLAAKICLEGYDISGGAFFFLRPELSTSSWIPNSRTYAFSIGKHDFYY